MSALTPSAEIDSDTGTDADIGSAAGGPTSRTAGAVASAGPDGDQLGSAAGRTTGSSAQIPMAAHTTATPVHTRARPGRAATRTRWRPAELGTTGQALPRALRRAATAAPPAATSPRPPTTNGRTPASASSVLPSPVATPPAGGVATCPPAA